MPLRLRCPGCGRITKRPICRPCTKRARAGGLYPKSKPAHFRRNR